MKKTIVLPVAVFALFAIMAYGAGQVKADDESSYHPMVRFVAERFGLNPDEVQEAALEYREEHHKEMGDRFEEMLSQAVIDGKITEEQRELIMVKHEEMRSERENDWAAFKDMTPEERRNAIMTHHEELKTWAEENGIDLSYFDMGIGRGFGVHRGRGMHGMGRGL